MRAVLALWTLGCVLVAHDGGQRVTKPTKAAADLRTAKEKLAKAKRSCCVKAACTMCLRRNGVCRCKENVAQGKGTCGECLAEWKGPKVELLATAVTGELPAEIRESVEALLRAKKTLAGEGRFQCCIRGGCGQCAMEGVCRCGANLAATPAKGVCGECYHGWHAGEGLFAGVAAGEVPLTPMEEMAGGMLAGINGMYASGTSQTPAAGPMNMVHGRARGWDLMLQGALWSVYTNQGGPRGRDKMFGLGWVMPMASRRVGGGTLTLRTMFSMEPLTVTNGRYPLLLQTGETWKGIPILNGQHPHDFVKELAGSYQYGMFNLYAGLRGDPALGPTAYPHRISASENPIAVVSHHYQDSTHVASSVVTAGVSHRWVTLEASGFHGREPDEKRWGMEVGPIDSFASRVTVTPSARWSMQYSAGRINNREATHPDRDTFRQTASLTYVRPLSSGHWATTLIWGRNHDLAYTQRPTVLAASSKPNGERQHVVLIPTRVQGQIFNSYLAESTARVRRRHWVWGRAELTDKDSLLLFEEAPYVRLLEEYRYTRIQAYTAGYSYELPALTRWLRPAVGGQMQVFRLPANLAPIYGAYPKGMQVWLRFRFAGTER